MNKEILRKVDSLTPSAEKTVIDVILSEFCDMISNLSKDNQATCKTVIGAFLRRCMTSQKLQVIDYNGIYLLALFDTLTN